MKLQLLTTSESQPDYLQLPLDEPLAEWDHPWLVELAVGVHRHVVRFIEHDGRLYALKELPARLAQREWDLLRWLGDEDFPVVDVLGVIGERGLPAQGLDDILITKHLEFSLPYRFLFTNSGLPRLRESLVDALAVLLVRLHLVGFWWGDCSLSNTLFRRDAGALSAWLVDTETGERHPALSDGQRTLELDIAQVNILGGLLDLEAQDRLPKGVDPTEVVQALRARYDQLWDELTVENAVPAEQRHLIDQRLQRLNDLGFDTTELSIVAGPSGDVVRFKPSVVEAGHHRRQLKRLTGLDAMEGQSRRLVNDIYSYGAWMAGQEGRELPEAITGYRWLVEVFEPTIAAVPAELRNRREPAELFHEILCHRDELEKAHHTGVKMPVAAVSYANTALPFAETEKTVIEPD